MIELSANTAMMLYLFATLSIILGIWIKHLISARKRKIVTSEHILCVCEYCHTPYLAYDFKQVTKCPKCKLFNKKPS